MGQGPNSHAHAFRLKVLFPPLKMSTCRISAVNFRLTSF